METKYTQLIDQYLSGELKGEELFSFKEQLKTDKQLQQELKFENELNEVILDEEVLDFRKEVINVRQEMKEEKQNDPVKELKLESRKQTSAKWYLLAASVVILIAAGYYYLINQEPVSDKQLYSQYYAKYPSNVLERSDEISPDDLFTYGLAKYNEAEYPEAITALLQFLEDNNDNQAAYLYLGLSYLEAESLPDAITNFKIIINDNNSLFVEQAQWYLVLSYFKTEDMNYRSAIINLLESLIEKGGDRAGEAEELLEKIQ